MEICLYLDHPLHYYYISIEGSIIKQIQYILCSGNYIFFEILLYK